MSEILDRLKGKKICMSKISDDCLKIGDKDDFIGTYCKPCFNIKQIKVCTKLNKKRKKIIQKIIELIAVPESESSESELDTDIESEDEDEDEELEKTI